MPVSDGSLHTETTTHCKSSSNQIAAASLTDFRVLLTPVLALLLRGEAVVVAKTTSIQELAAERLLLVVEPAHELTVARTRLLRLGAHVCEGENVLELKR